MKIFTVGDVADAIEKNGLPQIRSAYFLSDRGAFNPPTKIPLRGACAIGQACVNLGVRPSWSNYSFIEDVIRLNDQEHKTYKEIADYIRLNYDLTDLITADEYEYITES